MNFVAPATQKAHDTICKFNRTIFPDVLISPLLSLESQQMNFEVENKVRTLVAEMLLGMNDKLTSVDRSVRKAHQDLIVF